MTLSPRYRRKSRSPDRSYGSSRRNPEENSHQERSRTWKHLSDKKEVKREVLSRSPSPRRDNHDHSKNHSSKKVKAEERSASHQLRRDPPSRKLRDSGKKPKVKKEKKKHKKQKTRQRSSSEDSSSEESSSSESDPDQDKLQERLERERQRLKEEKRRNKEAMKARETIEEKRTRRLAKKLAKEHKKKADLGWDSQHMNYSNLDNPFNDANLTQSFIWNKKLEKDGQTTMTAAEVDLVNKQRIMQNKTELDKAYRRRQEREAAREEHELMQREKEAEKYKEWESMEDQFHLQQSRIRSQIRINERRAKAIDLLARYISAAEDDGTEELDVEMHEPYHYLNGLTIRDLEDLLEDIRVYRSLERGKNEDYWKDLTVIAEEEVSKLRKLEDPDTSLPDRREGIHGSVRKDVSGILKGKNHQQLALLETQILKKIKGGEEGVDIGYWESLLGHLKAHMARARLRDRHQDTLKKKLRKLKEEQLLKQAIKEDPEEEGDPGPSATAPEADEETLPTKEEEEEVEEEVKRLPWEKMSVTEREEITVELYEIGRFSPVYVSEEGLPPGTELLDPEEEDRRLKFARTELKTGKPTTSQKDLALEAEAKKGMGEDERSFSSEMPVEQQTFLWSDKYRPRKPRYFNRVHTGFEWNKYNQTHYDLDNPPPKIVQGYKFNIFYPDLLDPSGCPEFSVIPCDDPDFAVLKFKAGPPYEDIAFKIVNREWEANHKRGYRASFQNGIFQLWFHFKKYRYRR